MERSFDERNEYCPKERDMDQRQEMKIKSSSHVSGVFRIKRYLLDKHIRFKTRRVAQRLYRFVNSWDMSKWLI